MPKWYILCVGSRALEIDPTNTDISEMVMVIFNV